MIDLRTLKRVLAVDLGMTEPAIAACLETAGLAGSRAKDSAERMSLHDALKIVALAEALVGPAAA